MKISQNLKIVAVAAIFAALSCVTLYLYLNQLEIKQQRQMRLTPIIVSKIAIPANGVLSKENVVIKRVPMLGIPRGGFGRLEDVLGKTTKIAIGPGEYVTSSVLVDGTLSAGLAYLIPEGKRAMSIVVTGGTGVAGLINPGNMVDLIVSIDGKSITMLQQIIVLAVDKKTIGMSQSPPANEVTDISEIKTTLTLAVTSQQAQLLALAEDIGGVRLLLNPQVPEKMVPIPSSVISDIEKYRQIENMTQLETSLATQP